MNVQGKIEKFDLVLEKCELLLNSTLKQFSKLFSLSFLNKSSLKRTVTFNINPEKVEQYFLEPNERYINSNEKFNLLLYTKNNSKEILEINAKSIDTSQIYQFEI